MCRDTTLIRRKAVVRLGSYCLFRCSRWLSRSAAGSGGSGGSVTVPEKPSVSGWEETRNAAKYRGERALFQLLLVHVPRRQPPG